MGLVRTELHHPFCLECGGGRLFVGCDFMDHRAFDVEVAGWQVWLTALGQTGLHLCGGGFHSGFVDLWGVLPIRLSLDRGLV